jgi:hypothetical protein
MLDAQEGSGLSEDKDAASHLSLHRSEPSDSLRGALFLDRYIFGR